MAARSSRRRLVDEDDIDRSCVRPFPDDAERHDPSAAPPLRPATAVEVAALNGKPFSRGRGDEAEVLGVVEPDHLAAQRRGPALAYHLERQPRRLVYRSFGRADRNPASSNCSR